MAPALPVRVGPGGSRKPSRSPRRVSISQDGPQSAGDLLHSLGFESVILFENARGLAIVAFLALLALARGFPHFVPRPTGPMPAVNVP